MSNVYVTENELPLIKTKHTDYKDGDRFADYPFFGRMRSGVKLAGIQAAKLTKLGRGYTADEWRELFPYWKSGGIDLGITQLLTWRRPLINMARGDDDRLRVHIQGFGNLEFRDTSDGYMIADYSEAGEVVCRLRLLGNSRAIMGWTEAELLRLGWTPGNGDEDDSDIENDRRLPSSSENITWAA